ncbi:hypothetical protein ACIBG8_09405 [Nonomuraea sp. NPDC050556]|uniref:hypothetical protein n=1 Tax=Nonomuraea sp. NPDC050556 TaxID=3364369 RepID=UPI00378DAD6E
MTGRPAGRRQMTGEQQRLARGMVTEWLDVEVRKAAAAFHRPEVAMHNAHAARAAWARGESLIWILATFIAASASGAYVSAAERALTEEGGRPDLVDGLRAARDLLVWFLREECEHAGDRE